MTKPQVNKNLANELAEQAMLEFKMLSNSNLSNGQHIDVYKAVTQVTKLKNFANSFTDDEDLNAEIILLIIERLSKHVNYNIYNPDVLFECAVILFKLANNNNKRKYKTYTSCVNSHSFINKLLPGLIIRIATIRQLECHMYQRLSYEWTTLELNGIKLQINSYFNTDIDRIDYFDPNNLLSKLKKDAINLQKTLKPNEHRSVIYEGMPFVYPYTNLLSDVKPKKVYSEKFYPYHLLLSNKLEVEEIVKVIEKLLHLLDTYRKEYVSTIYNRKNRGIEKQLTHDYIPLQVMVMSIINVLLLNPNMDFEVAELIYDEYVLEKVLVLPVVTDIQNGKFELLGMGTKSFIDKTGIDVRYIFKMFLAIKKDCPYSFIKYIHNNIYNIIRNDPSRNRRAYIAFLMMVPNSGKLLNDVLKENENFKLDGTFIYFQTVLSSLEFTDVLDYDTVNFIHETIGSSLLDLGSDAIKCYGLAKRVLMRIEGKIDDENSQSE